MNQKQKDKNFDLFAEAFHEVVLPVLDEMNTRIKNVEERVESIDTKLFQITDFQADKLWKHEKRLEKLEANVTSS